MLTTRRLSRRPLAAAAVLLALLGAVLLAAPAQAAEKVLTITADGVLPRQLTITRGDTVVLVNDDASFRYRATSTTDNWTFDSGLLPLARGARYTLPEITESGAYGLTVFQGEDPFNAVVVLPAPVPAPAPAPSAGPSTAAPSPSASRAPAPASSSPSPAPTGGTGAAALPPLTGGFGAVDTVPSPLPGGVALPPALAPALPLLPGESAGPAPQTAALPSSAPVTAAAVPGDLPGTRTSRGYGLPAALAAVLALGVVSLLVRLLLAEPAARRTVVGLSGPDPMAAVD